MNPKPRRKSRIEWNVVIICCYHRQQTGREGRWRDVFVSLKCSSLSC